MPRRRYRHPVRAEDGDLLGMLPQEMDCCFGMTCWRRLRERLHGAVLDHLGRTDRVDWSRASLDRAAVPAPLSENTVPNLKRHGV